MSIQSTNSRIKILNIGIDPLTVEDANNKICSLVKSKSSESAYVVKPYVEFMVAAHNDNSLANILNRANLVLPDGVSLQWAASYLYGQPRMAFAKLLRSGLFWIRKPNWINQILPAKMAGVSQVYPLLKLCEKNNFRIGIIGSHSSPQDLKRNLSKRFPKLMHIYTWSGYFKPDEEKILVEDIKSANLDILFVAMGFPIQEKFIYRNINKKIAKVLIGEGGTFDYDVLGGKIRKAPEWIQKIGIEWFWRLLRQPKRLLRQIAIPKFILLILNQSRKSN